MAADFQIVQSHVPAKDIADITHDGTVTDIEAARAIDAAVPVLRALKLPVGLYRSFVLKYDGVFNVGFVDKDAPLGEMTGRNGVPPFEVRIDPTHLVPVGHNYMK